MPRFPKPFFRQARGLWYVQLRGRQINLGPDRDAAFEAYHRLMAGDRRPEGAMQQHALLLDVVDAFLEHCHLHAATATFGWYRDRLRQFARTIPRCLKVSELRPFDVQRWVNNHENWSNGTRRNAIRSIQRALAWAVEQGLIERSPIAAMRKPPGGRRELVVTPSEFARILEEAKSAEFRELLRLTWETGCRPQESLRVEARHVDLGNRRWVFPQSEGKTGLRVVYLTDAALAIVERLMRRHPHGRLLRNANGQPWTTDAVNCAFRAVRERMGRRLMKAANWKVPTHEVLAIRAQLRPARRIAGQWVPKSDRELQAEAERKWRQRHAIDLVPRYSLYALRHSWATHALQRGVDPLTVAILLGHRDPSMLAKVYQHLALDPEHLLAQLAKAVG